MNTQQSVFELWNYTFLFMTLSTLTAFTVDMISHRTHTISSNVFSLSVLLGITIGEVFMRFSPISDISLNLAISISLTIIISIFIPLKFRTSDPEVKSKGAKPSYTLKS